MIYNPRTYQQEVTNQILDHKRYLVVLDMGLGKTVSTLTAIEELMNDRFEIKKTLIIAPKRVVELTWPEEVQKWNHLKYLKYVQLTGNQKERIKALNSNSHLYLINIDNIKWLVEYLKINNHNEWPFDMIVIDESSKFKAPDSERFKALKKAVSSVERIVLLTGTPAPNGLQDLWSQIYLIDKGERLGKNITAFRTKYMTQNPYTHSWSMRGGVDEDIHNKISDVAYVLKAKGNINLPERVDNFVDITMDEATSSLYHELEANYLLSLEATEIDASSAAVLSGKLLQLSSGAIYDEYRKVHHIHDLKLKALKEIIEENEGNPILVFYWYQHDLTRLKEYFKELDPRELKDAKDKQDWDKHKIKLLLAHPASMGHGLNLQHGGSIIVWFSLAWSLELYEQANARLYRSGQEEITVINHLILKDTIDEDVVKKLKDKSLKQDDLKEAIIERRKKYEQHWSSTQLPTSSDGIGCCQESITHKGIGA